MNAGMTARRAAGEAFFLKGFSGGAGNRYS
jgi:hypothetical protein